MIPIESKVKGLFLDKLNERLKKWQTAKGAAARVRVPNELSWWYWNEFGTATRFKAPSGAELSHASIKPVAGSRTGAYDIDPVDAEALRFPQGGEIQHRDHVEHPGIRPSRSVTQALPQIERALVQRVQSALKRGAVDNPELLDSAILSATQEAKLLITQSMAENLPGTRELEPEHGRLGGRTAAEVFDQQATVEPLNGGK
jgi:hypothetical protein